MFAVRYVLPAVLVAGGFICLLVAPESTRLEQDRRDYFDQHGHWPDEAPAAAGGRKWNLPEGVATPESEAADERARKAPPDRPPS